MSTKREPLLDMFLFESKQLIEHVEAVVIGSERTRAFDDGSIADIFRAMHTIKGSAAMMFYQGIADTAHAVEDLFYAVRERPGVAIDYDALIELVLESIDYIKTQIERIDEGLESKGRNEHLIGSIRRFLQVTANTEERSAESPGLGSLPTPAEREAEPFTDMAGCTRYHAHVRFEEAVEMKNIRAYMILHQLAGMVREAVSDPGDLEQDPAADDTIGRLGLHIRITTERPPEDLHSFFGSLSNVHAFTLQEESEWVSSREAEGGAPPIVISLDDKQPDSYPPDFGADSAAAERMREPALAAGRQSVISVSVSKLDRLMDLVGELVIAESMVTQNPEFEGAVNEGFRKAARQLRKISSELQDAVMAIRMVPLSLTFQKMNRIVRDMSKHLGKEVILTTQGEETEVDKNIADLISDPLMHLIRNSVDHGAETPEERMALGKRPIGTIVLEARNEGGEVWLSIRDDGRGLDRDKIARKAREKGLLQKTDNELTDREVWQYIFHPGFSTNENVTEYSGRGVGMDVVSKNIQKLGGTIHVESIPLQGTEILIKIPLTLAIIDGMTVRVGDSRYTIPTLSIRESLRLEARDLIVDSFGNEMLLVRGECCPVIRLARLFGETNDRDNNGTSIIVLVEGTKGRICLVADELIGKQQVVIKPLPVYLKKKRGISGCTLLGDGGISLILDISDLMEV